MEISVTVIPGGRLLRFQIYKSWSLGTTNVSIPEVNMLKNSSTLAASVTINLSVKLGFVSVTTPGKLTLWMHYV